MKVSICVESLSFDQGVIFCVYDLAMPLFIGKWSNVDITIRIYDFWNANEGVFFEFF